jgi:hypothetical protein
MHMMHSLRPGTFVEIIDVLGAEIKAVAKLPLDRGQGDVGGIRLRGESIAATHGIETPYEFRIGVPGFGCGHFLDAIPVPEPSRAPEGSEPALGGDSRTGKDKQAIV